MNNKNAKIINRRRKRRNTKRFILITAILYITLLLAIIFVASITLRGCHHEEEKHDVIIETGENETTPLSKKQLYIDGVFYLPLSSLQKLTEIQVTGNKDKLSFIFEHNSEFAKFSIGTKEAEINSNPIELSHASIMKEDELYLPFDFYTDNISGISLDIDEETNDYTLSLIPNTELQFVLKSPASTNPLDENNASQITDSPLDFVLDLSSYEEYMNPADRDAYLILVSPDAPMDKEDEPTDLIGTIYTRSDRDTRELRKYACYALEAFLSEGEANGIKNVTVTSAFRSYDYQNQLYQQEVAIRGSEAEAAKHVNPPGISEHQTGLAVDMHNMSAASTAFGDTKEAKWLAENAHKFGFILRYPKNKTNVTGISYEPWHFRYVGRYHATKMYELGLCLEEYIEYIKQ